jgi:hypothetical protein
LVMTILANGRRGTWHGTHDVGDVRALTPETAAILAKHFIDDRFRLGSLSLLKMLGGNIEGNRRNRDPLALEGEWSFRKSSFFCRRTLRGIRLRRSPKEGRITTKFSDRTPTVQHAGASAPL